MGCEWGGVLTHTTKHFRSSTKSGSSRAASRTCGGFGAGEACYVLDMDGAKTPLQHRSTSTDALAFDPHALGHQTCPSASCAALSSSAGRSLSRARRRACVELRHGLSASSIPRSLRRARARPPTHSTLGPHQRPRQSLRGPALTDCTRGSAWRRGCCVVGCMRVWAARTAHAESPRPLARPPHPLKPSPALAGGGSNGAQMQERLQSLYQQVSSEAAAPGGSSVRRGAIEPRVSGCVCW